MTNHERGEMSMARWWRSAVVYQIYPRSFADSDGDGVGDLNGIRRRLDHLAWLGVDAVWLSPIFPSPMADFGYDVSEYCGVDPVFGTLDDLDRLVAEAHARGLRVLLDWVPNHTSDRHPWFLESRRSRTSAKRDWYYWRDAKPGGAPPNDWIAAFRLDQPAWTLDEATGQYYLHCFLPQQPDLNWSNPEVVAAMHGVLRFWLDRGIDGFRVDVVHALGKDPAFPDEEPEWRGVPHTASHDHASTHDILRGIRRVVDSYPGDRVLVGEVWTLRARQTALYCGRDQLHLAFDLPDAVRTPWEAAAWRPYVERLYEDLRKVDSVPAWVLGNHDTPRQRTRFGSEARARAAAVLLLTLPGTSFLYAGEELGLEDAVIPAERRVDPGGRDGCRAPIPWTSAPDHGWPADPWLPWPPERARRNAEALRADEASILHLYRRLLGLRRSCRALGAGSFRLLSAPDEVLAFERSLADQTFVILINFSDGAVRVPTRGRVEVASDRGAEGGLFDGRLAGGQAVLLRA
jgi:alpha-glucosidase